MSQLFNTLKKAQTELGKKLHEQGKLAFMEHLKEFFEANPRIEVVRWRQYTPGFNDGDACHFGYHGIDIKGINIKTKYPPEDGEGFHESYAIEDKEIKAAVEALDTDLSSMEAALQIAFGEPVQVTASRDGIETEDYDCGY